MFTFQNRVIDLRRGYNGHSARLGVHARVRFASMDTVGGWDPVVVLAKVWHRSHGDPDADIVSDWRFVLGLHV